ncbi:cache domain-containing protein [Novispirillum itersonii]|uniref:cache domain-containing protein n=1 Tax=Novispirillum itersonii TaxID=189 RepID=UPI00039D6E5E|nr:cache domain-containing protein [Novispirillum itersonii]
MAQEKRFRLRFQVSVTTAILAVIALVTVAAIGNVYYSSTLAARDAASGLFAEVSARVVARVDREMGETLTLSGWGARTPALNAPVQADGPANPAVPLLAELLATDPALYSLYVGRQNGDFLQVIATRNDRGVLDAHKAPSGTALIVRTITGQGADRTQRWAFLDAGGAVLARQEDAAPAYDPRERDWYKPALAAGHPVLSAPYLFNSLQKPGISASARLTGGDGVMGVDITLSGMAEFVSTLKISDRGGVVVTDDRGQVLAAGNGLLGALAPLGQAAAAPAPLGAVLAGMLGSAGREDTRHLTVDGTEMMARLSDWTAPGGQRLTICRDCPVRRFYRPHPPDAASHAAADRAGDADYFAAGGDCVGASGKDRAGAGGRSAAGAGL